ncbi:MAG: hypothetical protein EZS28_047101 [Streblomastix strix]|uniref:Uncharacterized protein n=1 Tax=Streblomastix strix TaxID=222440 RepID=A0A5J4THM4_9EUKA|nr:MAG: hypothetical protein EZS28_047101 [Streblomastix strix]
MGQDQSSLNSSVIKEIFSKDIDLQQADKVLGKLSSEVILLNVSDQAKNANTSLCKSIRSNLGNCKTENERLLLNYLEFLVEKGAQLSDSGGMNALHQVLTDSNLIEKVQKLILQKATDKQDQIIISPFANVQTQLIRVFLFMMKGQPIEKNLLESCSSNVERNIVALQNMIKDKYQLTFEKQIKEFRQDKVMENALIQGIKTLYTLNNITSENMTHLTNNSLPKQLLTFIHFNCLDKLNCEQQIKLTITRPVAYLIVAVMHILNSFTSKSVALCKYAEQQHNVIAHISARIWANRPKGIIIPEELQFLTNILTSNQKHL